MKEGLLPPTEEREPDGTLEAISVLPSGDILDGMYATRIRNPEALRLYVVKKRTEFLAEHPDREAELSGDSELGQWHGLVYSDTAAEYSGLAALCDDEIQRRGVRIATAEQALDPDHLRGVFNLHGIA